MEPTYQPSSSPTPTPTPTDIPSSTPPNPSATTSPAPTGHTQSDHVPMASNLNPALPPTYREMLQEMGKQLNQRKNLLFKRVLMITWPGLLLILLIYVGNELNDRGMLEGIIDTTIGQVGLIAFGSIYVLFAIIYMAVTGFLFEIEKQIWIDSHFDNRTAPIGMGRKDLTPKQSWQIAKKLFWPAFRLRFRIIWTYYLLPAIVFVAILVGVGLWADNSELALTYQNNIFIIGAVLLIVFLVLIVMYSYYIKVKTRYSWFVFLDMYKGEPFDTRVILSQMNALNTASKSTSFKRALVTEIGTDSANVIANLAVNTIGIGISKIPGVGQVLGGVTRAYGQALTKQATSIGKISAMYLLYRFARKELFGSEQVNNEYVYNLIDPVGVLDGN